MNHLHVFYYCENMSASMQRCLLHGPFIETRDMGQWLAVTIGSDRTLNRTWLLYLYDDTILWRDILCTV